MGQYRRWAVQPDLCPSAQRVRRQVSGQAVVPALQPGAGQCLAWCCLRQDFRRFKVAQMADIRVTDESFRPRPVPLLRRFIDQLRTEGRRPTHA